MKWALFFLGEYVHVFVGAAFFTMLFLGGWSLNPVTGWDLPLEGGLLLILIQFSIVLGKVFLVVALGMLIRWTLPRFRFDQLMKLAWEGMIPLGLLLLLMTSFFVFMGWTGWLWVGSLASAALVWLVLPFLPQQANPNHRIGLHSSRFSPTEEEIGGIRH